MEKKIKRKKMKKLIIILPTLNEEKAIVKVIKSIPYQAIRKLGYQTKVMVVDGHSKDKTIKLAREQGAEIIKQKGKGKGNAFKTILRELKKQTPEVMVMLDADNTYDPEDIPRMILPLIIGEADITIGSRKSRTHYIGNTLLTGLANKVFNSQTEDLCTGYWAFNTKAIKKIDIKANGFDLETDLFAQASKNKLRVESVKIKYRKRIGESKLTRNDAFRIIGRIIRNIRDWNPMVLFGLIGLINLTLSFIFGIRVVQDYINNGYIVAIGTFLLTVFLSFIGIFSIGIGLILDLLERRT